MRRITEENSLYQDIEQMSLQDVLKNINIEDSKIHLSVNKAVPQILKTIQLALTSIQKGGRIFYIGAGTSGRLGVLDASEILPTYGVEGLFIGLIAGGDYALRNAIEHAEDDVNQSWQDMLRYDVSKKDMVIGIAAGGTTPYVIGGVSAAKEKGLATGCITCNTGTELASVVDVPIEVVVGPEFITGSTRMKSGTAQKMVLNMISTAVMISLGRVKGSKMIDMKLSNDKLVQRGVNMIIEELHLSKKEAQERLLKYGSVRESIKAYRDEK